MALNSVSLRLIAPHIQGKVLSLGYPDICVPAEKIQEWFGFKPTKFTDNGAWHRVKYPLPDTLEFFEAFGCELTCVDIHRSRGCEVIADLNYEDVIRGKYDLVIDAGTTEHCFNVGQALMNAAGSVKAGGYVFHGSPMTMVNHGFYNFNPTLFYDFYRQNGWDIHHMSVHRGETPVMSHPVDRFGAPSECGLYFLAYRKTDSVLKFPTQTKYLVNPELKV